MRTSALIISALLIVWTGFLLISFLVMGLGSTGRIDPVGWVVLAALAVVVGLGGPGVWRCFKRGPGAGGRPILIAIGVAIILSIVGFSSGRDWLTIGIPMLLLAFCLAAIRKLEKNKV